MISDDLDEFEREVKMLVEIRHPHIVRFYGVCIDVEKQWMFMIMEYCPSTLLTLLADEERRFDFFKYALQLCETIE